MFIEIEEKSTRKNYLVNIDKLVLIDIRHKELLFETIWERTAITDESFDKLMKILTEETNNA